MSGTQQLWHVEWDATDASGTSWHYHSPDMSKDDAEAWAAAKTEKAEPNVSNVVIAPSVAG